MGKSYMTFEERQKAKNERAFKKQEDKLRIKVKDILDNDGITDHEFAEKAELGSVCSVTAFRNHPFTMRFDTLQKCCVAAGIVLGVVNDE